jgi:hypothetical protein
MFRGEPTEPSSAAKNSWGLVRRHRVPALTESGPNRLAKVRQSIRVCLNLLLRR